MDQPSVLVVKLFDFGVLYETVALVCIICCSFTMAKGNSYCWLLKTKLSIKSNLTFSTHVMLAGSPLPSTLSYLESLGRMDTIHQVVGWTLLTKRPELTCLLCKHATATKSVFVKTAITVLFYSIQLSASGAIVEDDQLQCNSRACCYAIAVIYQQVVQL